MMIDVNVSVDRWPFRRLPGDEPSQLVDQLQRAASHRPGSAASTACSTRIWPRSMHVWPTRAGRQPAGLLVPFGAVNPRWPDWREDLRRCHEVLGMPGIRLHPNYHGYRLDDPLCAELLRAAADRGLLVQLAVRLEDVRIQHPLMQVPDVDTEPLPALIAACPNLKLVLLNGLSTVPAERLATLAASGRVFLDIATLEGMAGIGHWLTRVPITCLLFGSHFPFFIWESAELKLRESALSPSQLGGNHARQRAQAPAPQSFPG